MPDKYPFNLNASHAIPDSYSVQQCVGLKKVQASELTLTDVPRSFLVIRSRYGCYVTVTNVPGVMLCFERQEVNANKRGDGSVRGRHRSMGPPRAISKDGEFCERSTSSRKTCGASTRSRRRATLTPVCENCGKIEPEDRIQNANWFLIE